MHVADDTFELTALRLHLAVGMAAADATFDDFERIELEEFVETSIVTSAQRAQLAMVLEALLVTPPALDNLLRALVDRISDPALAQLLVDDMVRMALIDDNIDPREEAMLRLVCGAMERQPVSLHAPHERSASDASAAELAKLVRDLLGLDAA